MIDALQLLARRNDVIRDTHGNLSARYGRDMVIKPSGMPYESITPHDLCWINIDTMECQSATNRKPSVDAPHHADIYRRHPWINAICHTHSPHATAFAMMGEDIECACTEQADYFGGPIICRGYRDLDKWGPELELDQNERAVLLESHGTLTFADNAHEAVQLAIALENVAYKTFLARNMLARRLTGMREGEAKKWHERYRNVYGQK